MQIPLEQVDEVVGNRPKQDEGQQRGGAKDIPY